MKLSIVIVNWNSKNLVRDCLASVRATCSRLEPQVIVVDGGSHDGCGAMIAAEFPEVEFIQSPDNLGFGRSNNLGFARVRGELLLLLNPDTVLRDGAVQALVDALEQCPGAGIVGAHLLNTDGSLQWFGIHSLPTPWNCAVDSDVVRRRWWERKGPADAGPAVAVEAVSGACMLMRAETFRRVGGFSPQYFMYGEDMDLCKKVGSLGLGIWYAPDARVIHHGGGSSRNEFSRFPVVMIREAHWVYMRLNHGFATALTYRFLMGTAAMARCGLVAFAAPFSRGETRERRLVALRKWWSVFRWAIGFERWAGEKFRACGRPIAYGAGACGLDAGVSRA
jgi:hypothetical protein